MAHEKLALELFLKTGNGVFFFTSNEHFKNLSVSSKNGSEFVVPFHLNTDLKLWTILLYDNEQLLPIDMQKFTFKLVKILKTGLRIVLKVCQLSL